jgi:hypothetical protein
VFYDVLQRCRRAAAGQKRKFRFRQKLLSIDSTTITLSLSLFDWAQYRRSKGAVKLHLILDHDGYPPRYAVLSDGRQADISAARKMSFAPGTLLVFDRGYADYEVVEKRPAPEKGPVRNDEAIFLFQLGEEAKECFLRRIEVWVEEKSGRRWSLSPIT